MGANAGIILSAGNTAGQFVSQQQQAGAITRQSRFNSQLAALDASDAVTRGDQQASIRGMQGRKAIGAERAAQAASGIDANSGTAVDLQGDEARFSELDQQMIKNNAAREAWGYTTQAALNAAGAENEAANLKAQSYNTLLTGAAKTYGLYRDSRQEKLPVRAPKGTGAYNVFRK